MTVTAPPIPATRDAGVRLGPARRTTPRRLWSAAIAIAVLALLTGLVAALATSERQGATTAAWQNAEPLMVTAQAVDTSLSDADTTAGASFLQGRLEPTALQRRYDADLALASADVAVAAREAGSDPAVATSLQTLSTDLPVYAGIVQDADFNETPGVLSAGGGVHRRGEQPHAHGDPAGGGLCLRDRERADSPTISRRGCPRSWRRWPCWP